MASPSKTGIASPGCAIAILAVCFVAGSLILASMLTNFVAPEWRANNLFVEHTCIVLDKRIGEHQGDDGPMYRAEIRIRYRVDGRDYDTWTYDLLRHYSTGRKSKDEALAKLVIGNEYPCWYDPDDPGVAVLVRGYSWFWIFMLLVPLGFVAVGAFGLCQFWKSWGKSPELLSAQAGRKRGACDPFPFVPNIDLQRHPGSTLAFRLPTSNSAFGQLIGITFVALVWNSIFLVFLGVAIVCFVDGKPDWCLAIFLTPIAMIGVTLIYLLFRASVVAVAFPPTRVEVSAHPLVPGEACQLFLAQRGLLRLSRLRVLVVCDEVARYTELDDTRTKTNRIHEYQAVSPNKPALVHHDFQIPAGAMHSFRAPHNEIQWNVIVEGRAAKWLKIAWEYPFIVRPASKTRTVP
jgi:Protein of unknown function (DUF3592)